MSGPTATRTPSVPALWRPWLGGRLTAVGRGGALFLFMFPAIAVVGAVVVAMATMSVGIGILLVPPAVLAMRRVADRRRRQARAWQGIEVPSPYRPEPAQHLGGVIGRVQRCLWVLQDPATWRDLLWSITQPLVAALALIPLGMILEGIYGFVLTAFWAPITRAGFQDWYLFIRVTPGNAGIAWATSALGAAAVVTGLGCAPALLRVNGLWTRLLLAPTAAAAMTRRVQHLTETRADAVNTSAAEYDAKAWHASGPAAFFAGRLHDQGGPGGFADTAYIGTGLCVPRRKPSGQPVTDSAREFNRAIASYRASIEGVIAHLKNWKLLATGYRGILDRFPMFLDTITKLEVYRTLRPSIEQMPCART